MPNKTLPTTGSTNWGETLNNFLTQSLDNTNGGGINKFDTFSQRPNNLTIDDKGKTYLYTQTGNIHQWTGSEWKVLNESVINVKDYGAIGDGVVDDNQVFNQCVNFCKESGKKLIIPAGKYKTDLTIDWTIFKQYDEKIDQSLIPDAGYSFDIVLDEKSEILGDAIFSRIRNSSVFGGTFRKSFKIESAMSCIFSTIYIQYAPLVLRDYDDRQDKPYNNAILVGSGIYNCTFSNVVSRGCVMYFDRQESANLNSFISCKFNSAVSDNDKYTSRGCGLRIYRKSDTNNMLLTNTFSGCDLSYNEKYPVVVEGVGTIGNPYPTGQNLMISCYYEQNQVSDDFMFFDGTNYIKYDGNFNFISSISSFQKDYGIYYTLGLKTNGFSLSNGLPNEASVGEFITKSGTSIDVKTYGKNQINGLTNDRSKYFSITDKTESENTFFRKDGLTGEIQMFSLLPVDEGGLNAGADNPVVRFGAKSEKKWNVYEHNFYVKNVDSNYSNIVAFQSPQLTSNNKGQFMIQIYSSVLASDNSISQPYIRKCSANWNGSGWDFVELENFAIVHNKKVRVSAIDTGFVFDAYNPDNSPTCTFVGNIKIIGCVVDNNSNLVTMNWVY